MPKYKHILMQKFTTMKKMMLERKEKSKQNSYILNADKCKKCGIPCTREELVSGTLYP